MNNLYFSTVVELMTLESAHDQQVYTGSSLSLTVKMLLNKSEIGVCVCVYDVVVLEAVK